MLCPALDGLPWAPSRPLRVFETALALRVDDVACCPLSENSAAAVNCLLSYIFNHVGIGVPGHRTLSGF